MRGLVFAKRNLKEIIRDPLSLVFCLAFPICLLLIFQLITSNFSAEEIAVNTPQFQINRLAPSIAVFGFSFITLFMGTLISKDRMTSFLARLKTSPMTSTEFMIGYSLPMIPIALVQVIVSYVFSLFFGLEINAQLMLSVIGLIPIALLFVGLGLLFGVLFTDKAVGGVSSLLVNISAIFGGMFMPLDNMGGAVNAIAYSLPFANALKIVNCIIINDYSEFLVPFIVVIAYVVVTIGLSIFVFKRKMNSD